MAYTKRIIGGKTYYYKDGKRIAASKVPAYAKGHVSSSTPRKVSSAKEKIEPLDIISDCEKYTKKEIIGVLSKMTKDELCRFLNPEKYAKPSGSRGPSYRGIPMFRL
jgi:hypothetical protein